MPHLPLTHNTESNNRAVFQRPFRSVHRPLLPIWWAASLAFAAGGCPKEQPPAPAAADAAPKKKRAPPPWSKKPKAAKPAPDESWIKDLKAISPREVVRRYLTLSGSGDLSKIKPLVLTKCHKTEIGAVKATIAFGTRMAFSSVEVELVEEKKTKAIVSWQVKGDVTANKVVEEVNILGKRVKLKAASATIQGLRRAGKLHLRRVDGQWKVACPKTKPVKEGFIGEKLPGKPHIPHLPGLGGHEGHGHEGHGHEGHGKTPGKK